MIFWPVRFGLSSALIARMIANRALFFALASLTPRRAKHRVEGCCIGPMKPLDDMLVDSLSGGCVFMPQTIGDRSSIRARGKA